MNLSTSQRYHRVLPQHRGERGFTLLELMVVVVIVAILTVIAVNSYQNSVMKSRRKAAEGCLQQGAQFMERYYATNLRYDKDLGGTANAFVPSNLCTTDVTGYYALAVSGLAATTYTIKATPTGVQADRDTQCGILALDQTGKQKYKNGTADTTGICW